MIGLLALTLMVAAAAAGPDLDLESYRRAERQHAFGAVTGRAHNSSETPGGPRVPLTGVTLLLVPRAESVLADVEAIKRQARDSLTRYRTAIGDVRAARESYVRLLREIGAGDLVRTATVDAEGRFTLPDVPAGRWMLIAEHTTVAKTRTPKPQKPPKSAGKGASGTFLPHDEFLGYQSVTIWLAELSIEGDRNETVELTDRNGWFSGVSERTAPAPTYKAGGRGR